MSRIRKTSITAKQYGVALAAARRISGHNQQANLMGRLRAEMKQRAKTGKKRTLDKI